MSVMMRGLMESVFRPQRLDEIFETHSKLQYTRELLFSSVVDLLSLVVCGIHPSVSAAYKVQGTYQGMMIAIPPDHWQAFRLLLLADLAAVLKELAVQVNLKRFLKQPRKSKTKKSPRVKDPNHPHVSTVRLLSRD